MVRSSNSLFFHPPGVSIARSFNRLFSQTLLLATTDTRQRWQHPSVAYPQTQILHYPTVMASRAYLITPPRPHLQVSPQQTL